MATSAEVTGIYKELLGRAPDTGGLNFYMNYGDAGAVRRDILASPERQKYVSGQQKAAPKPATAKPAAPPYWEQQAKSLYQSLGSFDKKAQNPLDMYNAALDQLGIADVRTRVTSLRNNLIDTENMLRNVDPNVTARTSNSLVTEAQRQKLVASEQAPIAEQLRTQGQNFDAAQAEYNQILGEGKTQAELKYEGQKQKRQALMDRLQTAISQAKTAEDKRRWQAEYKRLKAKDAEETRRWNMEYALKQQELAKSNASSGRSSGGRSTGGGGSYTSGGTSGGGSSGGGASAGVKSDGSGYWFKDASGKDISAAKYSQISGVPLVDLLTKMGASGDAYAGAVARQLKLDPFPDKSMTQYKKLYSSIFWGT